MRSQSSGARLGFTLIELLVVIAIIAVLIGLLLPAVQKVREASARSHCQNNLKQVAIGVHMHDRSFGAFPSGGLSWQANRTMNGSSPADYTTQAWGWAYQILPYIEQENLYLVPPGTLPADGTNGPTGDIQVASTPVKTYICPTRRGPTIFPYSQAGWSPTVGQRAMMDYVGNGGSWGNYGFSPPGGGPFDGPFVPATNTSGKRVTFKSITDGSSNTLLVGEKYVNKLTSAHKSDCNDDQGWTDGWDNDTICFAQPYNVAQGAVDTSQVPQPDGVVGTCGSIFGGPHASLQVVLCDGSVRAVNYNVSQATWYRLCSGADGLVLNPSDL